MGTISSISLMAWLIAGVCFILSLSGLSQHESSRRGNWLGIIGMTLAILAALFSGNVGGALGWTLLILAIGVGAGIGAMLAMKVEMTAMPQLVAILHSFVGLAAVLVGLSVFIHPPHSHAVAEAMAGMEHAIENAEDVANDNMTKMPAGAAIGDLIKEANENVADEISETQTTYLKQDVIHLIEIFLGVIIGGLTFTGSVVAWGKLDGRVNSKPLLLPGRHLLNLGILIVCILLGIWFCMTASFGMGVTLLIVAMLISFAFGVHMVMAIGGADMPVVVSMLNSYSGWAAAATGFMLGNDLLIVTGALVGSSGAILSYIMCHAMNRSFVSVIMGGFGSDGGSGAAVDRGEQLPHTATTVEEVAGMLRDAREVVVIPGYGMAVAQAQHPVREVMEELAKNGTKTRFAIHPVAGRLPGHMNVLLAEARVPYDVVLEMDEINEDFPDTDVVLVIGANDIVNPGALDDPSSPIYGMPVLEAWKAARVVIFKRSMGTGYSGVDNPLFYNENSDMLFGDAKASVDGVLQNLRT